MAKATTRVYISGPMTGYEDLNFPAFNAAARTLRLIGYEVINPAEFQTDTTGMDQDAAWRMYMRQDIKALMDCDAIVMLPEWPDSKGAVIERDLAIKLGMPSMTLAEAIFKAPAPEVTEETTGPTVVNALCWALHVIKTRAPVLAESQGYIEAAKVAARAQGGVA